MSASWRVAVDGGETSALYEAADGNQRAVFVAAHGAGGSMMDRAMAAVSATLRRHGFGVVRFNFLYKERKSGRPDPMPTLTRTFAAVVDRARTELGRNAGPLVIGGRSMGGRAGSMLAADGFAADGLLLLAYPLHPPGKPEQRRDKHLPAVGRRMLFLQGSRDAFGTPAELAPILSPLEPAATLHEVAHGDHSFKLPRKDPAAQAALHADLQRVIEAWILSAP